MKVIQVTSNQDWRLFHRVPHLIYRNDPNWICPLEGDIRSIFDPQVNKTLDDGEARLFVALDDHGRPVGRIAAFIDHRRNLTQPYPVGGIGFFESTDDDEVATSLFDTAESYLAENGIKAVDGPINFGERDKYWGLLTKGREKSPLFQENYQPAYYRRFFEDRGYIPFEQVLTLGGNTADIPIDRLRKVVERMGQRYDIHLEVYDARHIDRYAEDFCVVYNAAFGHFTHFKPLAPYQVKKVMEEAAPILDTQLLCMAYFEDQPAGFCAFFPDINPLLRPAKGKLNWRTLPGFLLRRRLRRTFDAKGIGFGIHPDFSTKGIFAFIVEFMSTQRNIKRYPQMYLTTVRAHNKEAVSIYLKLNVSVDRVHIAYRKALDPGIAIEPFEFIEVEGAEV